MIAAAPLPLAVRRSRKLIPDFRLHRPRSAADAVSIKAAGGPGTVFMAGGIDVINRMKSGAPVTDVIHLGGIGGLDRVEEAAGELRIGALVTHDRLAVAPQVGALLPGLAQTWPDIANIRIRCKGTLGGNVMARDPAYDFALAAMAGGARLDFLAPDGTAKAIPAGALGTARDTWLLTAIVFRGRGTLRLILDRSLRPIVTLAVGLDLDDGGITGGRVAIGCAYDAPVCTPLPLAERVSPAELRRRAEPLAEAVAANLPAPNTDHLASGAYRRRMIALLLRRNLGAAG